MNTKHRSISATCAIVALAAIGGQAHAQSAPSATEPPDFAAALELQQVVRDPTTGLRRGLTQQEISKHLRAEGSTRTAQQKRESRALNQMIQAMPATSEEALRNATPAPGGVVVVQTSREQLQPMYGVVGADGKVRAAHDPSAVVDHSK